MFVWSKRFKSNLKLIFHDKELSAMGSLTERYAHPILDRFDSPKVGGSAYNIFDMSKENNGTGAPKNPLNGTQQIQLVGAASVNLLKELPELIELPKEELLNKYLEERREKEQALLFLSKNDLYSDFIGWCINPKNI